MLLKLLKYDFRAMWKRFSLIWGAALILIIACNHVGNRLAEKRLFGGN